jgi:hypothetical protein
MTKSVDTDFSLPLIRKDITMSPSSNPAPAPAGFDLNSMRLPANYSAGLGVKKVLNKVPVGLPDRAKFFRVGDGEAWTFRAFLYEDKVANEIYIVLPFLQPLLGNLARPAQLYAAIDRSDNPLLIPVFLPGEDGQWNSWPESRAQGVEMAKTHWVRLASNKSINAYEINQATAVLPDPVWPDTTMGELIRVAFRGKIIDTPDHPVIRALQGSV